MWNFSATFVFCIKAKGLANFLLHLRTAFLEAHLLSPHKKWHGNRLYHCYTLAFCKFLSRDLFVEQRVYWEDGMFYFMNECTYCKVDRQFLGVRLAARLARRAPVPRGMSQFYFFWLPHS